MGSIMPRLSQTGKVPYVVSFHPGIVVEENLPLLQSLLDADARRLVLNAAGLIFPKYISPWRYREFTRQARAWFPRLDSRYLYPGKSAQIRLFRQLGVAHPDSRLFKNPRHLLTVWRQWAPPWAYPLVLKGDSGGGGSRVFPVGARADLPPLLARLPAAEPCLLQQLIEHGGRDLRVVIYGDRAVSYFREGADDFYNNISRGGRVCHHLLPDRQAAGVRAVRALCRWTGIDVAAFDVMFEGTDAPILVEINFNFGRKGLGGRVAHEGYFREAALDWRKRCLAAAGGRIPRA